jgi:hypothetical protein
MSFCPILSCPRTEPQEPRRPRFSFFYLHNVKKLTSNPRGPNVVGAIAPNPAENRSLHPVARRNIRPVRKPSTVGATGSASSTLAGYRQHTEVCQYPNSSFNKAKTRNQKAQITSNFQPLNHQSLSNFRSLLVFSAVASTASPAMSRVIGVTVSAVNPQMTKLTLSRKRQI